MANRITSASFTNVSPPSDAPHVSSVAKEQKRPQSMTVLETAAVTEKEGSALFFYPVKKFFQSIFPFFQKCWGALLKRLQRSPVSPITAVPQPEQAALQAAPPLPRSSPTASVPLQLAPAPPVNAVESIPVEEGSPASSSIQAAPLTNPIESILEGSPASSSLFPVVRAPQEGRSSASPASSSSGIPLFTALGTGTLQQVRELFVAGRNETATDIYGRTPIFHLLHSAMGAEIPDLAEKLKILIEGGAKLDVLWRGRSAIDLLRDELDASQWMENYPRQERIHRLIQAWDLHAPAAWRTTHMSRLPVIVNLHRAVSNPTSIVCASNLIASGARVDAFYQGRTPFMSLIELSLRPKSRIGETLFKDYAWLFLSKGGDLGGELANESILDFARRTRDTLNGKHFARAERYYKILEIQMKRSTQFARPAELGAQGGEVIASV